MNCSTFSRSATVSSGLPVVADELHHHVHQVLQTDPVLAAGVVPLLPAGEDLGRHAQLGEAALRDALQGRPGQVIPALRAVVLRQEPESVAAHLHVCAVARPLATRMRSSRSSME